MTSRTRLVYGLLIAVLALIITWQVVEHDRVKASARAALINRSRDITTTLGLVIRSQRRFGGSFVSQERIESALKELVKPGRTEQQCAAFNGIQRFERSRAVQIGGTQCHCAFEFIRRGCGIGGRADRS